MDVSFKDLLPKEKGFLGHSPGICKIILSVPSSAISSVTV